MEILLIILIGLMIYNITIHIPNKLKEQDEKQRLHFEELRIRLNRIENSLEEIRNMEKIIWIFLKY